MWFSFLNNRFPVSLSKCTYILQSTHLSLLNDCHKQRPCKVDAKVFGREQKWSRCCQAWGQIICTWTSSCHYLLKLMLFQKCMLEKCNALQNLSNDDNHIVHVCKDKNTLKVVHMTIYVFWCHFYGMNKFKCRQIPPLLVSCRPRISINNNVNCTFFTQSHCMPFKDLE